MLYEVTSQGTYFNQQVINRWNYVSTGIPAAVSGSFALAFAMGALPVAGVLPPAGLFSKLLYPLSEGYAISSVTIRAAHLYDPVDFYEVPYVPPQTGDQALAGSASPVEAYGFRTNRVRLDIDRGTKRLVGVTEANVDAGGVLPAGVLVPLNELAALMSAVLIYDDEGNQVSFAPCIVQKEKYVTDAGNNAYKYYETLAEQLQHIATGIVWQPYSTVRTQNSRQYGRGA